MVQGSLYFDLFDDDTRAPVIYVPAVMAAEPDNSSASVAYYVSLLHYYWFRLHTSSSKPTATTTDVLSSKAATLQAESSVTSFTVEDTPANVARYFDSLNADTKLTGITLTTSGPVKVTATQFADDTSIEAKLPAGTQYAVSGVTVADAAAIEANTLVRAFSIIDTVADVVAATGLSADTKLASVTVSDTASDVVANLAGLSTVPALTSIALTGGASLAVTGAQFGQYTSTLDLLTPIDRLTVSAGGVAQASGLQKDMQVTSFSVSDTSADVLGGLSALSVDFKLSSVALTGGSSLAVTATQFFMDRGVVDKLAKGDTATVSGVTAMNAAQVAADTHVGSFSVTDTLANIGTYLSTLETYARSGELTAIDVMDSGQTLTLSPAEYAADADAIALMQGNFTIAQTAPATHLAINIIWDSSAANAPVAWKDDVEYAVNYFESLITTPITINLRVGYGEAGGSSLTNGTLGEEVTETGTFISASQFKNDLRNDVTSDSTVQTALANLSGGSTEVYITGAEEKAFGLLPASGTEIDAAVGFAEDPNGTVFAYSPTDQAVSGETDFIGVVETEISHALGRESYIGWTTALDLYRYTSPGILAAAGSASYFSINGGATNLGNFAQSTDTGDWASGTGPDANDLYAPTNAVNAFSAVDVEELNVLGYSLSTSPPSSTPVAATGTTSDVASASGGLNQPSLRFIGTPEVVSFGTGMTGIAASIEPAAGIEDVSGLVFGTDTLTINLSDLTGALEVYDTQVNGAQAIALTGSGDLSHGLVLTGLAPGDTAANLISHHLTVAGDLATIA
jgi:hypothetical protein